MFIYSRLGRLRPAKLCRLLSNARAVKYAVSASLTIYTLEDDRLAKMLTSCQCGYVSQCHTLPTAG